MTKQINAESCPSEKKKSSKAEIAVLLLRVVGNFGTLLKFADFLWEWVTKAWRDHF